MIVALFGITCVGKTTIGKIVSEKLGWEFYDLDEELKKYYNDTITNIQDSCFNRHEYDGKKGTVLKYILDRCGTNTIIAVSPIYYTRSYKTIFKKRNVFPIVLQDEPENIARRMIETDDEDNIIENYVGDFKEDLRDVKYFISYYKNAHKLLGNKYDIDGKSADESARQISEIIQNAIKVKVDEYKHFSSWLDEILEAKLPEELVAISFNLHESIFCYEEDEQESYDVELIGLDSLDKQDSWDYDEVTTWEYLLSYPCKNYKDEDEFSNFILDMINLYFSIGQWKETFEKLQISIGLVDGNVNILK